jgi:hypothetical protein
MIVSYNTTPPGVAFPSWWVVLSSGHKVEVVRWSRCFWLSVHAPDGSTALQVEFSLRNSVFRLLALGLRFVAAGGQ